MQPNAKRRVTALEKNSFSWTKGSLESFLIFLSPFVHVPLTIHNFLNLLNVTAIVEAGGLQEKEEEEEGGGEGEDEGKEGGRGGQEKTILSSLNVLVRSYRLNSFLSGNLTFAI